MTNEMLPCVDPGPSANPKIVECGLREPVKNPHSSATNGIIFKCAAKNRTNSQDCPRELTSSPPTSLPPLSAPIP